MSDAGADAGAGDAPPDVAVKQVAVTDEELAQCVAVLKKLHGEHGHAQFKAESRFKPLRSALLPLMTELRARLFHGNSADHDTRRQDRKRKRKIERAREKALDQQFINNTKLRADRIARLEALTAANPLLAQVPDGVGGGDATPKLLKSEEHEAKAAEAAEMKQEAVEKGDEADASTLNYHRACYTCKQKFRKLHHFYDRMCPACAALNYTKRLQTADLRDHVAIVTGARVKIGYEIALKLLRAGATVVATTRFPKDAAFRFAKEKDFADWKERLEIYGMDFRDLGVIDRFMNHIEQTFGRLDILVNNATQTIRRPVHYYKHLLEAEVAPVPEEFAHVGEILRGNTSLLLQQEASQIASSTVVGDSALVRSNGGGGNGIVAAEGAAPASVLLSQVPMIPDDHKTELTETLFPDGQVDQNKQQVDLRTSNSWVMKIDEIETMGTYEVVLLTQG